MVLMLARLPYSSKPTSSGRARLTTSSVSLRLRMLTSLLYFFGSTLVVRCQRDDVPPKTTIAVVVVFSAAILVAVWLAAEQRSRASRT